MRTREVRPWWWWINPWLYIKRRDIAYDDALDSLRELCLDVRFPQRRERRYSPDVAENTAHCIAARCRDCGRNYVAGIVEDNA